MTETTKTKIWAWRWSAARGWAWELQRDALPANVPAWLETLRRYEPGVDFRASEKRPRGKGVDHPLPPAGR